MSNELYHYGIKGMKWGVRRYRNKDGELYLPKGSVVKRVSNNKADQTYNTHGTNVSKDPLIVLNPDANLTRISDPEYTRPVKDYLKLMYGITA